jgi:hypothetical protein
MRARTYKKLLEDAKSFKANRVNKVPAIDVIEVWGDRGSGSELLSVSERDGDQWRTQVYKPAS